MKTKNFVIKILDIFPIKNPEAYKLHLGSMNNNGEHPLDLFVKDQNLWKGWNEYCTVNDVWNRDYIFSLIEFYPKTNSWLFGGVFKVLERKKGHYVLEDVIIYKKYIGRVLLSFSHYKEKRGIHLNLEDEIDNITVSQIFEHVYTDDSFPGYENINHDFHSLENIFKMEKPDWKSALENVKGIYLITDSSNGKFYIGSTTGTSEIWSRWANYIGILNGWNDKLVTLINKKGKKYAKRNFKFSILELHGLHADDVFLISRESYWKEKLLTRVHGYNSN